MPVEVLCLTEHWLKKHNMIFNLQNYKICSSFNRVNILRGGSMILVRNCIKAKERKDVSALSVEHKIELSCIELEKYIIVCVYRPPYNDNFDLFEAIMEDVLKIVCKSKKNTVVCGDFNIDLLVSNSMTIRMRNLFNSFNLSNIFLEPTRITDTSATCIDNIYCECKVIEKTIINSMRSDHSGQLVTFPLPEKVMSVEIKVRPVTEARIERFKDSLLGNISDVNFLSHDSNNVFTEFCNVFVQVHENNFPTKQIKINLTHKFSEWATTGIRKSRDRLFHLYEQRSYTNDNNFKDYVKKYSKVFKKICIQAKSNHIAKIIRSSSNKAKAVWKVINNETGKVRSREHDYAIATEKGLVSTNTEVAQAFDNFFTNIPYKTTEKLNSTPGGAESLMKANVDKCQIDFKFHEIDSQTIIKAFKSLNLKNTEDLWGLSVRSISSAIFIIASPLAYLFNLCIEQGVFPDLMKMSKVVPIFKSGNKTDPSNFRPVSVLPIFSKIFEKIMLNQMLLHFNLNNLFHRQQYGFMKGRNTVDAGVSLFKLIFDAWENAHNAIGIFCDLSKAFDCVDHATLLIKLEHYGFKDVNLAMIRSYLEDRIQKVEVNGFRSSGSKVRIGVPQGSILGPFLFLVYVNDLPFMVQKSTDIVLFADDTSLIFKVDRKDSNLNVLNSVLRLILNWFTVNNLVLNAKKTKCINFCLPNVRKLNLNIILDNDKLECIDSTVFLGITLDAKMQWGPHIDALSNRLSSAAYAIWKIRQLTDVATARLVYFSYFHSIMSYGILLWGRAADIKAIFILQKRAIRAIYNLRRRDSLRELFKEINILTVAAQFIYENIMYVRKNLSDFPKNSDRHNLNLRNKDKLDIPVFRLRKTNTSFMGYCVRFYNLIPKEILNLTEKRFKNHVKSTLCKKAYYTINDYMNDKNVWCTTSLQECV